MTQEERFFWTRTWSADPNAYAGLQPGLRYFDHPAGYLAYRRVLSGNVSLGDPVAPPDKQAEVLAAFLQKHGKCVFSYLTEPVAQILRQVSRTKMHFVPMAVERCLYLTSAEFSYSPAVAGALKKARKAHLQILEKKLEEVTASELSHLQKINADFIKASPAGKEIGFISRAMLFAPEPDVRFFMITAGADPLPMGFFVLDPWYDQSRIKGYQLHQFRLGPCKIWGVYLSVVAMLMVLLKAEGITCLSLGAGVDLSVPGCPDLPSSKAYHFCKTATITYADKFHPLKNLSKNKYEFAGTNLNRYLAAPHTLPLLPLLRFAKANHMRMIPKL